MKVLTFLKRMFGFKKNTKYVKTYLNDANIKSSIYMSFIVIVLEIWMIFRQTRKYIHPYWNTYDKLGYNNRFQLIFGMTGLYILFIVCALAMFMFGLFYVIKKRGRGSFITNIILGSLCILWIFVMIIEIKLPTFNSGTNINKITTILVYSSMPVFGASIVGNSLYRHFKNEDNTILSIITITCFAAVCLVFGFKVGYSDFANPWYNSKGDLNTQKIKMITCFLTMMIFAGCLLIWKPYISIVMLTSIFVVFDYCLCQYGSREFIEADRINYYTFLVSLTMITISIYQQRVTEAIKDEKLIHDANFDSLVEIHNGHHFTRKIIKLYKENSDYISDKIYLFINVSNFKIINTQKGFTYGDKFLTRLAKDVVASFPKDQTARLADDHFIVLTNQEGFMDRIDVLNRLVQASSDGLFIRLKVGGYRPQKEESPFRAIDKARYACGTIKSDYGTMFMEYDKELDEQFMKRQYIVNHIDDAVENGYIKAYYQPVVWSSDQTLCGAEALARWIDPVYGMIMPRDFIPVLEETRLIHKLDLAMLNDICKQMRRSIDENRPVVPVSLNLSRTDFDLINVKEELNKCINKYNIDKSYLHVELTESGLSQNTEEFNAMINELKADGFAIWLDDFGSGYSSLNALKDFEFDVIKIDMKFLTNFDKNERTKDILDCIIQLATRLGMRTLTEGVETREEAEFLNRIGCGRLQGFLFGKPFSLEHFEKHIHEGNLKISDHLI